MFQRGWQAPGESVRAFLLSLTWHLVVISFPFPLWKDTEARTYPVPSQAEIIWYTPPRPLPRLQPPRPRGKAPLQPAAAEPERNPVAVRSRQRIEVAVPRPTHPRQTLIQPESAPEPPKILPPLPNLVQWASTPHLPKPRPTPQAPAGAQLQPRARSHSPWPQAAALDLAVKSPVAELKIALASPTIPKPRLAVAPAAPQAAANPGKVEAMAAPELVPAGARQPAEWHRVIALSAHPAEPTPVVEIPAGNLTANLSLSPEGSKATAGSGAGNGESGDRSASAMEGPAGVHIGGDDAKETTHRVASGTAGAAEVPPVRPLPMRPQPTREHVELHPQPALALPGKIPLGTPVAGALSARRTYTLLINMPNLTSATGSWVLEFAELDLPGPVAGNAELPVHAAPGELSGPEVLRKVDPRYPPTLRDQGVAGEVILYAIIRKNGSVDSIQVVRGLHPELDRNAMEALAQWKFEPARRNSEPVELEAIVRIPFRPVVPP
ncbi:MAG: TonB family protein [Firmicutes bacterium]|nr:TonB family protein [Bacillota bacterium]